MRRLEEALHDLAAQDERLATSELITRIERHLSGERDSTVVALPGRSATDTHENTRQAHRRRWAPAVIAAGAALLVLIVASVPILFALDHQTAISTGTVVAVNERMLESTMMS